MTDGPDLSTTRRRFLGAAAAAAVGALGPLADRAEAASRGPAPNILILMVDEMRFPPVYESAELEAFRQQYLLTQNALRSTGVEFTRHYASSVACAPSRSSLYTGHYPSLHGVTQTTGAAKESFDPDVFWLDPNGVPTLGDYFRAAGYQTFWKGKWHISDADLLIPGTHQQIVSYDSTGAPEPTAVTSYLEADRLDRYGFSGWVGPEPHGRAPLNSGSSAENAQGRDVSFAAQARGILQQLDASRTTDPWLVVASFVNPHDITLFGLLTHLAGGFDFAIEDVVPFNLFQPALFQQTLHDDLSTKPTCQASYQESYRQWLQPIVDRQRYSRFYYQLHKNVDAQLLTVYQTLLGTRFRDNTIVLFTSDHGDLLGAHNDMHQKWYTAYEEALRVPLLISGPGIAGPRSVDTLTSHVDVLPTLLGLAGLDPEPLRQKLAVDHTDALPLVGRDLAALVTGEVSPASITDPIYFMTDDDPSRGLNQNNWTGIAYASVIQPNHIETVITRLADGHIWKSSRYFDNPQFWSTPGVPGDQGVQDVVLREIGLPDPDKPQQIVPFQRTEKLTPVPEEHEMYDVTADPMELSNLAGRPQFASQQATLAALLAQQCAAKRLHPVSGAVPGQPGCGGVGSVK